MGRTPLNPETYATIRQRLAAGQTPNAISRDMGLSFSAASRTAKTLALFGGTNLRSRIFRTLITKGPAPTLLDLIQMMLDDEPDATPLNPHDIAQRLWDLQKQQFVTFRESKRGAQPGLTTLLQITANDATYARLGLTQPATEKQLAEAAQHAAQYLEKESRYTSDADLAPRPDLVPVTQEEVRTALHREYREGNGHDEQVRPELFPLLSRLVHRQENFEQAIALLRVAGANDVADLAAAELPTPTDFEEEVLGYLRATHSVLLEG